MGEGPILGVSARSRGSLRVPGFPHPDRYFRDRWKPDRLRTPGTSEGKHEIP